VSDRDAILERSDIDLVVIAAIPRDRAALAIEAMRAGKDVMVDKPGCTTMDQLSDLRAVQAETGRIWSIDFSERFEVPSVTLADELVQAGAIGRVVQTVGLGPHRLNRATRPDWFFDRMAYGGILTDIASHQIDQFLHFTGSQEAEITHAAVENFAHPGDPGLQDFGEIALRAESARGYIRVDWFTPDALPNWGDGRLTILGTEGYIELRKYVGCGRPRGDGHADPREWRPLRGDRCARCRLALFRSHDLGRPGPDRNCDDTGPLLPGDGTGVARAGHGGGRRMIRVAIIGAGIGAEHLAGYRALPDRFSRGHDLRSRHGPCHGADGWRRPLRIVSDIAGVLVDDSIDLVDICLPPHLHAEVAIAALDAGKHVICEKPLARSLLEVDAIRDAADSVTRHAVPGVPVPLRPRLLRA
jgi:predicted dehydrogenase